MTDLFLTPRLRKILPQIQEFVKQELVPLESLFLQTPFNAFAQKYLLPLREKIKAMGLWGLHLPEGLGGMGLSLAEFGQISEALAWTPFGHFVFNCQAPDIGNMELLWHFGTEAQKQQYLAPLAEGNIRSCFAMTEPEFAGSNPVWLGTTATAKGDKYVIQGHKWFTTGADGASFTIVMVITNPEAPALHHRASMIIVPLSHPNFKLLRNISIMGETGEGWLSHAEVQFEQCEVPITNRIGEEGQGFSLAQHRLGPGRIHHCMRWIGIAERSLDLLCQRAVSRQLSPKERLADKQVIQHWIAESRANINAARLMVLDTARLIDQRGAAQVRNEISAIKFFVANIMLEVVDRALQVHGGLGMTDDLLLSFWYRHERAARIYDGADEVHKSALAKSILKEYVNNSVARV